MAEDGKEGDEHEKCYQDKQSLPLLPLSIEVAKECHGEPEHRLYSDGYSEDIKFEHEIKWLIVLEDLQWKKLASASSTKFGELWFNDVNVEVRVICESHA